jgi:tetrahydromethanopterin S-methyltransferase subunit E
MKMTDVPNQAPMRQSWLAVVVQLVGVAAGIGVVMAIVITFLNYLVAECLEATIPLPFYFVCFSGR